VASVYHPYIFTYNSVIPHCCSFPFQCYFSTIKINVFVFFCHIAVYTLCLQPDFYLFCVDELGEFSHVLLKVMLALCGLWNVDFFYPLVPPFCVSPNMKNLHTFALEYT